MTQDATQGADHGLAAPGAEPISDPTAGGIFGPILEVAADAVITIDESQVIVHFNRGAEQIFGYDRSEVLGRSLSLLLPARFRAAHPGYIASFGQSAETARLMGHRREVFGLRKDGTEFPAEASILKLDAHDGRRLYTAVVRDVTDRKRMDQQQRFLSEVSAALSGSLDYDATLESVARLPVPTLADACVLDVLDESGKLRRFIHGRPETAELDTELMTELMTELETEHVTDLVTESAMRERAIRTLLTVPLNARGQPIGVLTLLGLAAARRYDSSDVVVAENFAARAALAISNARLYRAAQRATRARDEVLGVVSHDLRNPLSAIAMCSRVLTDTPPASDADRRELARTIHDSTTWMSRMIQDLLDVSAVDAGVLSVVCRGEEVEPIVSRAADLFTRTAADRAVQMTVDVESSLPRVQADAERLVQAVANLIGNAVKFTPAGGSVGISARARGGDVEIVVEDTGRGIAESDLPHIFDRYWHSRGAAAGTGLGLAIARGIVEAHHGKIEVTSSAGVGSRFSILLRHENG